MYVKDGIIVVEDCMPAAYLNLQQNFNRKIQQLLRNDTSGFRINFDA